MDKLSILLTGAGAPGCSSIINCLRNNGERELNIVGTDANPMAVCRSKVDTFYQIPKAGDPNFIDALIEICKKEKIKVVIPIVTRELEVFAKAKAQFSKIGTIVATMDYEPLHIANNKGLLLTAMRNAGLPTAGFIIVHTPQELISAIKELGYPHNAVVIKPTFGNGSRGTRVLDASKSRYEQFFNEKPNSSYISLEELTSIIEERNEIPEMLAMEYLPNTEISVDILADNGETIYYSCRQGNVVSSIMVSSEIIFNYDAINIAKAVTKLLNLSGNLCFDMRVDKNGMPQVMEINPRLPAGIVGSVVGGVNFPYLGLKQALGETLPNCEVREGYKVQFRNEEVLYSPDGCLVEWKKY